LVEPTTIDLTHEPDQPCCKLTIAAAKDRSLERQGDVGIFLHSLTNDGEVPIGVETARTVETDAPRLVPIDAVGLDDVIDHPPLLTLAPRHRLANRLGLRNGRRWGVQRPERLPAVVAARVARLLEAAPIHRPLQVIACGSR
jgi:hypothetical protein